MIQRNSSSRLNLKNSFNITIRDEPEEISSESEEDKVYNETPETKGLLPPLPNEPALLKSPKFELFDQEDSSPPSVTRARSSTKSSVLCTPTQDYIPKFETPNTDIISPKREILSYSPAITIEERFEVSLDIPIAEDETPKTTEEKIKFYEKMQKKELAEFNKTLISLRKSGWMSEKELIQLETSKIENFNNWETKINALKQEKRVKKKESMNSLGSVDEGYFHSPKKSNGFEGKKLLDGLKSPSLQTLEQKFSALGMK